jgi:hypothetical protein
VVNLVSSSIDLVDKVVDPILSSVDPTLPSKSESQVNDPSPSTVDLVHQVVDSISPSIDPTPPLKSEDVTRVFLVTEDSSRQGGIPPIPKAHPPSNLITIDWNSLIKPRLPSYTPLKITIKFFGRYIPNTIIDEGYFDSILSSNAWKALRLAQLAPVTQNLLDFNRMVSQPLGILPHFIVNFGGEMLYIDVMVFHDPLHFNFLLEQDYLYAMKYFVHTLSSHVFLT